MRLRVLLLAVALSGFTVPAVAATADGDAQIEARWQQLGGADGPLGPEKPAPDDVPRDVTGVPGARVQDYTNGSIYWSEATGARMLRGPVLARYLAVDGPVRLGLPTSEEAAVGNGSQTVFQRARIYWHPSIGARELLGPVLAKYLVKGGPTGRLGFPTVAERATTGGRRADFQGGRIYWSKEFGADALWGPVLKRYIAIGAVGSYLGIPRTSEYAVNGGSRNGFRYGTITYYPGRGTVVTGTWRPSVEAVTARQIPYTYRSGCPVGPSRLRRVNMPYYDWSGVPRFGKLIVRASAADDMQRVFRRTFSARFPIRRMNPVDVYRGSDVRAMEADNTSAFNCRKVTGNPYRLSQHSYGNAIDINTFENPYVTSSQVYPSGARTYLNRSNVRKGMIVSSGPIARGMRVEGWPWGARWAHPDYQHFSSNGG